MTWHKTQKEEPVMKKLTFVIIAGLLAAMLAACGKSADQQTDAGKETTTQEVTTQEATTQPEEETTEAGGTLAGGWTLAESDEITDERREIFDTAVADLEAEGIDCHPIMYLGSQVVAGTNHCYIADITDVPKNKNYFALVFIYQDLEGNDKFVNMHELEGVQYANEYDPVADNFGQYYDYSAASEG